MPRLHSDQTPTTIDISTSANTATNTTVNTTLPHVTIDLDPLTQNLAQTSQQQALVGLEELLRAAEDYDRPRPSKRPSLPSLNLSGKIRLPKAPVRRTPSHRRKVTWGEVIREEVGTREFWAYLAAILVVAAGVFTTIMILGAPYPLPHSSHQPLPLVVSPETRYGQPDPAQAPIRIHHGHHRAVQAPGVPRHHPGSAKASGSSPQSPSTHPSGGSGGSPTPSHTSTVPPSGGSGSPTPSHTHTPAGGGGSPSGVPTTQSSSPAIPQTPSPVTSSSLPVKSSVMP